MDAAARLEQSTPFQRLRDGRAVLLQEGRALLALADRLSAEAFSAAVELLLGCRGSVIVSGVGKAGHIGRKISATLASTGSPSHFVHPVEALHGDLGSIQPHDVVLMLSHSGRSEEILQLLPALARLGTPVVAITGSAENPLARAADAVLELGPLEEACPLGLAPSTSTSLMLALGDALALVVSRERGFASEDFAARHPGGALGKRLANVEEVMRPLAECRVARDSLSLREVLMVSSRPGRRTGAIMLVSEAGQLSGIFTDSDLARFLEASGPVELVVLIDRVMPRNPLSVVVNSPTSEAVQRMAERKISELPVIDRQGSPCGLIDVTDLIGWLPAEAAASLQFEDEESPTLPFSRG